PPREEPLERVPVGLDDILRRALDPDPARRFESALALRDAVREFVSHRGSAALAAEAETQLLVLFREVEARGRTDVTAWRQELYRRYGECRFGFQQALKSW